MPLNLPSIKTTRTAEPNEHEYHIYAVLAEETQSCPDCKSTSLYKHSKKNQLFMDTPMHGKRVGIILERTRLKCRDCNKTFFPVSDDFSDKHRATKRLVKYIQTKAMERTCISVAHDIGISEGNVRKILKDHIEELERKYVFKTPKVLGLDEAHLNKKMRLVMTNIKERTILDLVENRNKATVIKALQRFKEPHKIEIVTMDMWRPYRDAVNTVIPHAIIVIDKFHIVKMANEAVDRGRKSIREEMEPALFKRLKKDRWLMLKRRKDLTATDEFMLSGWIDNYPLLFDLYERKEQFFEIFDSEMARSDAEDAYKDWRDSIKPGLRRYFSDIDRAVSNWHTEVFNYFDYRYTNAYTEAVNNQIKAIYKQGRGYNFDVLRARLLFRPETHKTTFKSGISSGVLGSTEPPRVIRLGVNIATKKRRKKTNSEGLMIAPGYYDEE